jgi:hypothetical protein
MLKRSSETAPLAKQAVLVCSSSIDTIALAAAAAWFSYGRCCSQLCGAATKNSPSGGAAVASVQVQERSGIVIRAEQ